MQAVDRQGAGSMYLIDKVSWPSWLHIGGLCAAPQGVQGGRVEHCEGGQDDGGAGSRHHAARSQDRPGGSGETRGSGSSGGGRDGTGRSAGVWLEATEHCGAREGLRREHKRGAFQEHVHSGRPGWVKSRAQVGTLPGRRGGRWLGRQTTGDSLPLA